MPTETPLLDHVRARLLALVTSHGANPATLGPLMGRSKSWGNRLLLGGEGGVALTLEVVQNICDHFGESWRYVIGDDPILVDQDAAALRYLVEPRTYRAALGRCGKGTLRRLSAQGLIEGDETVRVTPAGLALTVTTTPTASPEGEQPPT
jgi:hypothetical protein